MITIPNPITKPTVYKTVTSFQNTGSDKACVCLGNYQIIEGQQFEHPIKCGIGFCHYCLNGERWGLI